MSLRSPVPSGELKQPAFWQPQRDTLGEEVALQTGHTGARERTGRTAGQAKERAVVSGAVLLAEARSRPTAADRAEELLTG